MPEFKTILPSNSTLLEQDIERVNHDEISALPVPLRELWRVDSCPAELLPWLAWALSVDVWSDTWTNEIKRNVIGNSVEIHKYKGTLYAVELAIKSLGIDAAVSEWSDDSEKIGRGRFKVDINNDLKNIATNSSQIALKKFIDRSKRLSAHYAVSINSNADSMIKIRAATVGVANDLRELRIDEKSTAARFNQISGLYTINDDSLPALDVNTLSSMGAGFFSLNYSEQNKKKSLVNIVSNWTAQEIENLSKDLFVHQHVTAGGMSMIYHDNEITVDDDLTVESSVSVNAFINVNDDAKPIVYSSSLSGFGGQILMLNYAEKPHIEPMTTIFSNQSITHESIASSVVSAGVVGIVEDNGDDVVSVLGHLNVSAGFMVLQNF
ncbi:MAG: phage tail protein I [Methylococcales bacterium]|nr:phage tail protein I [Methylococcales bacterium]